MSFTSLTVQVQITVRDRAGPVPLLPLTFTDGSLYLGLPTLRRCAYVKCNRLFKYHRVPDAANDLHFNLAQGLIPYVQLLHTAQDIR
jgi:hypothetical protein